MTNIPVSAWPKPYLLEIYEKAIEHGCVRVDLKGDATKAASLKAAFYRLRRRSDKQHASFILPEYHLVTFTWEAELGTALFTFNKLPDGSSLPAIVLVDPKEAVQIARLPTVQSAAPVATSSPADDLQVDLDELLRDINRDAAKKLS